MFEKIIGHEENKEILHDDVMKDKVSHAYLFVGPKGIGKRQIAEEFAKGILKTNQLQNYPDYRYIGKKEDKKDILVEQIRKEIIDDIYLSPVAGDKKVYLIDDAELLNITSQNTLLKTLEEPPKYVVMILVSSNHSSFLPTILSRVSKIYFHGVESEKLDQYIKENYHVHLESDVISFFDGSIGQAVYMIENDLLEQLEQMKKIFQYLTKKDIIHVFEVLDSTKLNEVMLDYLEFLLDSHSFFLCTEFVERAKNRLKMNGNYDIVMDNMLLNIMDCM